MPMNCDSASNQTHVKTWTCGSLCKSPKIGNNQKEVRVQWDLIDQLLTSVDQHLKENYPEATFDAGDTVNHLLKQNDFVEIVEAEIVDQTFEPFLVQAFEAAIASFDQSRVQEGTQIKQVLLDYVAVLTQSIQELQALWAFLNKNTVNVLKRN